MDAREAVDRGFTLPWEWYVADGVLRREQKRIFRRAWQYAGHAGLVEEPGAFFTSWAGDVPIVVVRDREEGLRAFLNVCRHRGHEVASGAGRRSTLQCPYHAWTYDLDGSLRAAPRSEREAGFDRREYSLVPVLIDTWGPFLFVNPDPDAPPLAEALGPVPELVARSGLDVDRLVFRQRVDFEVRANWKVTLENFLECYHCSVAHPGFSKVVDVDQDAYRLEAFDGVWSQFAHLRDGAREEVEGQFHLVWPNVTINIFPGIANLSIGPSRPVSPERTSRFLDYFFGPEVTEEQALELLAFDDQVGREDRELVESVQRGIGSGVLEHGRLLLSSEHLIQGFQRRIAEALAE